MTPAVNRISARQQDMDEMLGCEALKTSVYEGGIPHVTAQARLHDAGERRGDTAAPPALLRPNASATLDASCEQAYRLDKP